MILYVLPAEKVGKIKGFDILFMKTLFFHKTPLSLQRKKQKTFFRYRGDTKAANWGRL